MFSIFLDFVQGCSQSIRVEHDGYDKLFQEKDIVFSLGCFLHLVYFARTTHDKRCFT